MREVFYGTVEPDHAQSGDTWFHTGEGHYPFIYNGSEWVPIR